jgi:DNA-binding CsgD family transcriptional regulator
MTDGVRTAVVRRPSDDGPPRDDARLPGPARGVPEPPRITRGAELVLLAGAVQIRLFRVLAGFLLAGCGIAVGFAVADGGNPDVVTCAAAAAGLPLGVAALLRPQRVFLHLRRSAASRVVIVACSCVAVLLDGVDGPAWWVALGVAMLLATVTTALEAVAGAFAVAVAFAGGALLAGGSLARDGADAGVLAGASGLPLYALVVRVVADGFARVLLMVHRARMVAEHGLAAAPEPVRATGGWGPVRAGRGRGGSVRARRAGGGGTEVAGAVPDREDAGRHAVPRGGAAVEAGVAAVESAVQSATPAGAVADLAPTAGPDLLAAAPVPLARRPQCSRLTVRQLEVALLARDGLLQAEIAEALAISVTQVERHLRQARERVGAATVGELLAVLVADGVIGARAA